MSSNTLLIIILVLLLVGALPTWPHSRGWGYGPIWCDGDHIDHPADNGFVN
jgi:hypothetical protein